MDKELAEFIEAKFHENREGFRGDIHQVEERLRGEIQRTAEGLRDELRGEIQDNRRQFGVIEESLRSEIQQVAEGYDGLSRRIEILDEKMSGEFSEVKAMIRFSFAELERRIQHLESRHETLEVRVSRLEGGQA